MENIVRKGEIACNKQFLQFSQCFLPYIALTCSSPEHEVLRVSYCDHSPSVGGRHPSVVRLSAVRLHFLVYTLASTNINLSAPN